MARALRLTLAAVALCATTAAAFASDTIALTLDRATIIRAPEKTSMVVVGNPAIADVTVQKNGVMVLTGKNFGETNLLALDDQGKLISESWLRVEAMGRNRVTVYRGVDAETYACSPSCQPTVALGDSDKHFGKTSGQVGVRNALAAGQQSAAPSR
ncbi:MAG: pilus assembly protein N-terminal domain-containing protein [Beijerinckiaceae bacterium]